MQCCNLNWPEPHLTQVSARLPLSFLSPCPQAFFHCKLHMNGTGQSHAIGHNRLLYRLQRDGLHLLLQWNYHYRQFPQRVFLLWPARFQHCLSALQFLKSALLLWLENLNELDLRFLFCFSILRLNRNTVLSRLSWVGYHRFQHGFVFHQLQSLFKIILIGI